MSSPSQAWVAECLLISLCLLLTFSKHGVPMTDDLAGRAAKGGEARAAKLSPEKRKEIAQSAALARWHGDLTRATHEGTLTIADLVLQCAVLEDGRRVLSERSVLRAFGIRPGGARFKAGLVDDEGAARLPMFVSSKNLRPFIDNELLVLLTTPIMYRPLGSRGGGRPNRGLDANLIPKVCEIWLNARNAGALRPDQHGIAGRADGLIRGLARRGIIAMVDDATGYQEIRDRLAIQAILDAYLSRELAAWANRFPPDFYQEIFRLRGWTWDEIKKKAGKGQGPRVVGKYTNDFVYARLAPGVLEELQKRNPANERGQRRAKHHQWLTEDVGHPALAQHLHAVIGLLRASDSWEQFQTMINRAFPRRTDVKDLPLFSQGALPTVT
jgi:P63C domain-containing protein